MSDTSDSIFKAVNSEGFHIKAKCMKKDLRSIEVCLDKNTSNVLSGECSLSSWKELILQPRHGFTF